MTRCLQLDKSKSNLRIESRSHYFQCLSITLALAAPRSSSGSTPLKASVPCFPHVAIAVFEIRFLKHDIVF